MIKICFLGLSRSGKTCYLYAASNVLSEGISTDYGTISIMSTNEQQNIRLNKGVEDMEKGIWPKGSNQTMVFPFDFFINGQIKIPFQIYDYRGGALYDMRDDAQDEREELYETFKDASCIVFFIDAYTLLDAFNLKKNTEDDIAIHKKGSIEKITPTTARNRIKHIELIVRKCREMSNRNIPMLLTITKKDILSQEEIEVSIEHLKTILPTIFSGSNNITGITSVSLGKDLGTGELNEEQEKKLTGNLILDISQNLHIPILFALCLGIEISEDEKRIVNKVLNNDAVRLFVGGERVVFTL